MTCVVSSFRMWLHFIHDLFGMAQSRCLLSHSYILDVLNAQHRLVVVCSEGRGQYSVEISLHRSSGTQTVPPSKAGSLNSLAARCRVTVRLVSLQKKPIL